MLTVGGSLVKDLGGQYIVFFYGAFLIAVVPLVLLIALVGWLCRGFHGVGLPWEK
jgi:hypothetical protein